MNKQAIPGRSIDRIPLEISIDRLHLDSQNPRLPEEVIGHKEFEILKVLYEEFNLEEIAVSMATNGYFAEEPLVVIPIDLPQKIEEAVSNGKLESFKDFIEDDNTHFTVVEGNRRLSAAKILLDSALQKKLGIRSWPFIEKGVRDDLLILPAIVYPTHNEVLPYLGVRHITGIKKWDAYAKARYIRGMIDVGHKINDLEQQVGDTAGTIRKNAACYSMLRQAQDEFDYDVHQAKEDFSLLILSVGQRNIKRFLGLPSKWQEVDLDNPVPEQNLDDLKKYLIWLFGKGKGGTGRVIKESRDITNYLSYVVSNPAAIEYLEKTGNLMEAFDFTDGEEMLLKRTLSSANLKLEKALGIVHRYKENEDIIEEVKKCQETLRQILKTVSNEK